MQQIKLIQLTISRFRSFRKTTKIEFDDAAGAYFLSGNNKRSARLGANGAGKSTIWDALVWCLYGTSVKGLRTSDLVSWGAKNTEVSVIFSINADDAQIEIKRTGPPNKLYLNSEEVGQETINEIIRLSRERFLHSVLYGQSAELFADLSIPARGVLFDSIFDLSSWTTLADAASKECAAYMSALAEAENEVARYEGQLQELTNARLEKLAQEAASWQERVDANLLRAQEALSKAENRVAARLIEYKEISGPPSIAHVKSDRLELRTRMREQEQIIHSAEIAQAEAEKTIKFFNHHQNCPTCGQSISKKFVADQLESLTAEKEKQRRKQARAQDALQELQEIEQEKEVEWAALEKTAWTIQTKKEAAKVAYDQAAADLKRTQSELAQAETDAEENALAKALMQAKQRKKTLSSQLKTIKQEITEVRHELEKIEYWKVGFKQVRLFMVERMLQYLTLETANAVNALGLTGWKIEFVTEKETKSGTLKQGIQIIVTSPEASAVWGAWSGGEGQRLRIAISLGLSSMIQRMAGVEYAFEVWDEPSSWLSTEGVEDLMAHLVERAAILNKQVWVLDHRALAASGFTKVWEVTKTRLGSSIAQLS